MDKSTCSPNLSLLDNEERGTLGDLIEQDGVHNSTKTKRGACSPDLSMVDNEERGTLVALIEQGRVPNSTKTKRAKEDFVGPAGPATAVLFCKYGFALVFYLVLFFLLIRVLYEEYLKMLVVH